MGTIKDLVDLAKDLESRAKDRRDMDTIHKIQSLAFSLQAQHADVVERDIELMRENSKLVADNAKLESQLTASKAEDVRIHRSIEFRRGERTGGKWTAFCPKCHMPAAHQEGYTIVQCSDRTCKWHVNLDNTTVSRVIPELGA
jgi:hypothetical protein